MGKAIYLDVDGRNVLSVDVTYNDLIWLYKDFENKNGRLPLTSEGKAINNLPQQRIIKRVLEENHITYNDFMNSLGKVKHIRTESKDYDLFVERYKDISNKTGTYLVASDLVNNSYGLPCGKWFWQNCPDKSVKNFTDFVKWCGFHVEENDKSTVSKKLIALENDLGRPITGNDITIKNIGFSMIVITRIWGTLNKCKKELGLMKTLPCQPKPFSYYKAVLDEVLDNIANADIGRNFISWKDIENPRYCSTNAEHKSITKAFRLEGLDVFAYIKSKGFLMNPSDFSFHYTFDDGERVVSSKEYDFSRYIKSELGLKYNNDYHRDVMYRKFLHQDNKFRTNCDYEFVLNDKYYYVEIAGIISNAYDDWETKSYSSKQEQEYQKKLLIKKKLLEDGNKKYLFLFPEDFLNNEYKQKFLEFTGDVQNKEIA